jgi:pyruvate,orthophosphate dikinase
LWQQFRFDHRLQPQTANYSYNLFVRRKHNVTKKWVYLFSEVDEAEEYAGDWEGVRALLGGKGANLAEMTRIDVPVPPGFTMTTEACNAYLEAGEQFPEGLWEQTLESLKDTEARTGKKFGDPSNPLLVSVRSGAKFSMPGMMDTVLNVGLNDETVPGMVELTGNERFVWDSYRRLLQMYGSVVLGISDVRFEEVLEERKEHKGVKLDTELEVEDLQAVTESFKEVIKEEKGFPFPQEPLEQLRLAAEAVFNSWFGKRAVDYRNAAGIRHDLGTGVNVQTMVFGNMGWDSGTGVAFTRDPATGEKTLYGDYLMNAQGEDVVAGIRNTKPIQELEEEMPEIFKEFVEICDKLEHHYREMQDVEFTIENDKLWMLQTRDGKRTATAAVKIAVDMADEGIIDKRTAVQRISPNQVDMLLHPQFDLDAQQSAQQEGKMLATGVNASPGAAVGVLAFDADTAEQWGVEEGKAVIMLRPETKPDDVHGMIAAKGILTSRGGATSHAAVVARQFGIPAVVGCEALNIDLDARTVLAGDVTLKEGDVVSLDGGTGQVFIGEIETVSPSFEEQTDLVTLLGWADEITREDGTRQWPDEPVYQGFPTRGLEVWTNADYPQDAERARQFGAKGIGLCRTEHMFFEQERLPIVQKMILSKSDAEREAYLDQLLPFQQEDFEGLFRAMDGLPVIIRLIDPPLHEFLPSHSELLVEVTEMRVKGETGPELEEKEKMLAAVESMEEANPMMGLRGIRLGITMPGITKMQVRAIFQAACAVAKEGVDVHPEVMIPLTGHVNELKVTQSELEEVAKDVMAEQECNVDYKFGTMIEIPRASLTADDVASVAQFFSYGTNDLTQMTFGYSRDDAERGFLLEYVERGILPANPFQELDQEGVGKLVEMGAKLGRKTRPELEVGICGEHGGDPSSIDFCHRAGLNYVSCSPFRVPVARLAAAHAAMKYGPRA